MSQAPFGTWKSPITAEAIAAQSKASGIEDVFLDIATLKVYFAQNRPEEDGRSALVSVETGEDIIPREFDARTRVHEYGGAAAAVRNGVAYFSNMADNRVYTTIADDSSSQPMPVTPVSSVMRFASFSVHPLHSHLVLATCEDHVDEGWHPWRVRTYLVLIDASTTTVTRIWTGTETPKGKGEKKSGVGEVGEGMGENDFFAYAQWSEDGKRIVWQQWAHPELAWQSACIYVASISLSTSSDQCTTAKVSHVHHVSGAHGAISSLDPKWLTPTTGIFVSDEGGWANPWTFTVDPDKEDAKPFVERAVKDIIHEEFGGPQWWLSRTFSASLGNQKAAFTSFREGRSVLSIFDFSLPLEKRKRLEVETPFVTILYVRGNGEKGVFLGQAASKGEELTELSVDSSAKPILKPLLPPPPSHPVLRPEYVSPPIYRLLRLKAVPEANLPERVCHITYYSPKNPEYAVGEDGEKPPVIVLIHGGPYYMEACALDWMKQFWTSRGWAHIDVNYGGSTGFGRAFRESLHGHWGIMDIHDAYDSVLALSELGLVDHNRAVIHGGSAGGYSTLQAATTLPNAFSVGSPHYGISEMRKLDAILHKQEYFLCDRLMGGTYEECPEVWHERSPIYHVNKIKMPMLFLQGEIDTVIPVPQMKEMVEILKKNGNDAELMIFPGEGHGWRKATTIKQSLEKELEYFSRVLNL